MRVGNAASTQLQLDVYGELLEAAYETTTHGSEPSEFGSALLSTLLDWLEDGWRQKDAGLWEVRGPARHFTHSKVMSWVAFDRALKMNEALGGDGRVERWRALREEIHAEVLANAWGEWKQAFTQSYGSDDLDAAVLLIPLVGLLPATDPRVISTVEAIRRELSVGGLLLYRPDATAVDGIPGSQGAFLACSFWLVRVLELQGRHDEASCSSDCSSFAATSACSPRSTTRSPVASSATSPRLHTPRARQGSAHSRRRSGAGRSGRSTSRLTTVCTSPRRCARESAPFEGEGGLSRGMPAAP